MKITVAKNIGFCFGVKNALQTALQNKDADICTYGEIIHNSTVVKQLEDAGIKAVDNLEDINTKSVIIRSHGVGKEVYNYFESKGINVIDATCPFVNKTHEIAQKYHNLGFQIAICGKASHAEVIGINGWCDNTAIILENYDDCKKLISFEKVCLLSQTTFSIEEFKKIIDTINKLQLKTLEIFDTICYTTKERQDEAVNLAKKSEKMLILGSQQSSNTKKLFEICKQYCKNSFFVSSIGDLASIKFSTNDNIGLTAGASTPNELIQEVLQYMNDNGNYKSFEELLDEESKVNYKKGTRINDAEVILCSDKGLTVRIGGKNDGFVAAEDVEYEGEFVPSKYPVGIKIDAIITGTKDKDTGLIPLSKKEVDAIKIGNKAVENIRNNEEFSIVVQKAVEKGLIGRLGNYRVFVPQSHIAEYFVKNLEQYIGKTLRLRALEINDTDKKIVASQKVILSEERKKKEDEFFSQIYPDAVVIGKVVRSAPFGAFVNVGGFDCLVHITDLAWNKIGKIEEVLTIGQEYEFLVLKCEREKNRVSLGYKQLHLHPFYEAISKYNIGQTIKGKVVRLQPFGAFVEIEKGLDGLVHISEISYKFFKNINEALKVGDEVDAVIIKIDEENRKVNLSIKATLEPPTIQEQEDKPSKKQEKTSAQTDERREWSEDTSNNVFANLLKDDNKE